MNERTQRTMTLLVNPSAGHGRARRRLPSVARALTDALPEVHLDVVTTTSFEQARALASSTVRFAHRGDSLVVMGGDGMASVGHNACGGTDVPLGVIPAGTGNDFCRGVGLPGTIRGAVATIAGGHTGRIDLMRVNGNLTAHASSRLVGSVVSTGFDELVNARANRLPISLGAPSYAYAVMAELVRFRPLRYRIELDGRRRTLDAMLIAVGNAGIFGGGIKIIPDADVRDGLLDVTVIHPVSRRVLIKLLPRLFTGTFVSHPCVEQLRAHTVIVDGDGLQAMADGEDLGTPPLTCHAEPGALRLFLPR
ncbi:diacylglycerol/lipid kinase family protein [Nigerium massiliense]|uniref:diacylglycerol/lipid kinase family protein n=1 Tax=Nigerium massiliense TaxID=1522317 RepID=UPI000A678087|nr:diacylglycerol kinase family protein [Nigerium massiliense]